MRYLSDPIDQLGATVSYSKDCLPKGLPTRPTRSVPTADPYRPVLNIFQKNRECDFFEKLCVGKLADRRPTRRTDPFRTVPFFIFFYLFIGFSLFFKILLFFFSFVLLLVLAFACFCADLLAFACTCLTVFRIRFCNQFVYEIVTFCNF